VKVVFGLGNPGPSYGPTRHNIGFDVIDLYRKVHHAKTRAKIECSALVYREPNCLLVKPLTFMNESGIAVSQVIERYGVAFEDALVVYDDLDLPLGRMKLLASGGAGSHNGMRSVLSALGHENIPRLRIGIETADRCSSGRDYVLSAFSPGEWEQALPVVERAVEAVDLFLKRDIYAAMTQFNRRD